MRYRMHAMLLVQRKMLYLCLSPLPKHTNLLNLWFVKRTHLILVICMSVLYLLDYSKDKLIFNGKHEEINNACKDTSVTLINRP